MGIQHCDVDTRTRADERAERNRLVEDALDLADRIAHDYTNRGIEFDDLRQVAYLALVRAANRFDASRGTPFEVFASVSINGEIKRHFRDCGWSVRPPRGLQEMHLRVRAEQERLTQQGGHAPSVSETADSLGVAKEDVRSAVATERSYRAQSLDAPLPQQGDTDRSARLASGEPGFDGVLDRMDLTERIEALDDRERKILELRYRDELPQAAIGERIGVGQVQVSRLLKRILRTLRREPVHTNH